ncbi:hypothetical protein SHIRM173S_12516 [Streptomyces hirsutus]
MRPSLSAYGIHGPHAGCHASYRRSPRGGHGVGRCLGTGACARITAARPAADRPAHPPGPPPLRCSVAPGVRPVRPPRTGSRCRVPRTAVGRSSTRWDSHFGPAGRSTPVSRCRAGSLGYRAWSVTARGVGFRLRVPEGQEAGEPRPLGSVVTVRASGSVALPGAMRAVGCRSRSSAAVARGGRRPGGRAAARGHGQAESDPVEGGDPGRGHPACGAVPRHARPTSWWDRRSEAPTPRP